MVFVHEVVCVEEWLYFFLVFFFFFVIFGYTSWHVRL